MTCPDCKRDGVSVERTNDNGDSVSRRRKCTACGATWWTDERLRRGSLLRISAQGYALVDTGSQGTPPVRLGDLGGQSLSDLSVSVVNPAPSEPLSQTQARVSERRRPRRGTRIEYPSEFQAEWELTAKTGSKEGACDWWEANGKPAFGAAWGRWEACPEWRQDWYHYPHVVSWLRDGRWNQDPAETRVKPAAPAKPVTPVESFARRDEREREERRLDARADLILGRG